MLQISTRILCLILPPMQLVGQASEHCCSLPLPPGFYILVWVTSARTGCLVRVCRYVEWLIILFVRRVGIKTCRCFDIFQARTMLMLCLTGDLQSTLNVIRVWCLLLVQNICSCKDRLIVALHKYLGEISGRSSLVRYYFVIGCENPSGKHTIHSKLRITQ